MTNLDKFKRRLIRSVARMIQNQVPEEVAWEELQKATGFDCKLLWSRMKTLTMKKLQRLLAVEDQGDSLAGAARMSVTDWLLFDLVLAHDKIDVIGKKNREWAKDNRALKELFKLVQQHNLEPATTNQAERWMALTKAYNTNGRRSSPMLLQRRWHQMKEATRAAFYSLWSSYRGNQKLWEQASRKPTLLEAAIAKRYPDIITKPFLEWGELVQKGLVVMPEQFEVKSGNDKPKQKDDKPDLVMIEPVIETIHLASDDEGQIDTDETSNHSNNLLVNIKTEPQDLDGLSNVRILETTHMGLKTEHSNDSFEDEAAGIDIEVQKYKESNDETSDFLNLTKNIEEQFTANANETNSDDLIKQKAEEFIRNKQNFLKNIDQETSLKKIGNDDSDGDDLDDIIKQKTEEYLKVETKMMKPDEEIDDNFAHDVEFVDDGIEYVEEDEDSDSDRKNSLHTKVEKELKTEMKEEMDDADTTSDLKDETNEDSVKRKIDLKLLLLPVVYTLKLDQMNVFKDTSFLHVKDDKIIGTALAESKPISKFSAKEDKQDNDDNFNQIDEDSSSDEMLSDDAISEHHKVKLTSYLLQKPKSRTYNPIQLCKNPDFNTRLKRLNVGFFTSPRNRQLLNACMPVTIDLHKAFEPKLINGTLYLKSGGRQVQSNNDVETPQLTSVMPVAMPAQSLLSSEQPIDITSAPVNVDTVDLTKLAQEVSERNKVINLRDLSEIRRINQKLLTAEVTPIRIENNLPSNPVQDLITDITNEIEQQTAAAKSSMDTSTADELEIIGMSGGLQTNSSSAGDFLQVDEPKLLEEIRQPSCSSRGRGRGRGRSTYIWNKPKQKPPTYAQLPQRKITAPWLNVKQTRVLDEGLITADTLNRMIGKLTETEGYTIIPEYMNRKKSAKPTTSSAEVVTEEKLENSEEVINDDNSTNTSGESSKVPAPPVSKQRTRRSKTQANEGRDNTYYCCWSREKMIKIASKETMRKRHKCKDECKCCCRELLYEQISKKEARIHFRRTKTGELRPVIGGTVSPPSIVLSDDEPGDKKEDVPKPTVRIVDERYVLRVPAKWTAPDKVTENVTPKIQPPVIVNTLQTRNPVVNPGFKINISFTSSAPTPSVAPQPQTSASENTIEAFQTIEYNPAPPSQPKLPKLCPKPTIDTTQRKIVIDGSTKTPIYKVPNIIKKSVYLKSQKSKECPIYLGQNKILLTTVKFPPELVGSSPADNAPAPIQSLIVAPNSPMSYGVQLVVLPNGELTYTVGPGVALNDQQLAMMPSILAAVKQQLTQIHTSQGLVDLTQKKVTNENAKTPTVESEVEKNTETQELGDAISSGKDDGDNVPKPTDPVEINDAADEQIDDTSAKENPTSEIDVVPGEGVDNANVNSNEAETKATDSNDGSRNLLSDLMEMSGISAEDTTPAPQESESIAQVEPIIPVASNAVVAAPVEPIVATTAAPPVTSMSPLKLPSFAPLSSNSNIVEDCNINYSLLTPVNSLAELKYACAHNGLFFKLDVVTGVLVPINVSVKKNIKGKKIASNITKSVIDLTDDGEKVEESTPIPQPGTLDYDNTIKPVKLFRSISVPKILQKKRQLFQSLVEKRKTEMNDAPKQLKRHMRKQAMGKIEARIDLIDSDEPMEEEYLVDSDESDSEQVTRKQRTASKSDDSSDEEPLAVKSKRLKTNESEKEKNIVSAVSTQQGNVTENITEECDENKKSTSEEGMQVERDEAGEEADEEPDDDMEVDHPSPQMLTFFSDEADSQEDCILGV